MAKMTIAQLREREIERLVTFKTSNPTEQDYNEARRNMNSFYRLCGLCETNLNLAMMKEDVIVVIQREVKKEKVNGMKDLIRFFMIPMV